MPMILEFSLYYLDVFYINAMMENDPVSDDKPTVHGEEPLQREVR